MLFCVKQTLFLQKTYLRSNPTHHLQVKSSKLLPLSKAHNPDTHLSSMNFSTIAKIFVGMSEHPALSVMLIFKSFSSFFNFFLPFSCKNYKKTHMILNKLFNQKQVKMKRWEYPSNQKTTHGALKKENTRWLHETLISRTVCHHI